MCFTPGISFATAIFEFLIATIILFCLRKSLVNKFFSIFIYTLGFYQLTEFFLCTSNYPMFWAKIGFITYSVLPAIFLHFVMRITKVRFSYWMLYIIPSAFALYALSLSNFIIEATCSKFFVLVKTVFFNSSNPLSGSIYWLYYFSFILFCCYFLYRHYEHQKNVLKKELDLDLMLAGLLSLFAAIVLFLVFPSLGIVFPSVYCQFAILFTAAALIAAYLDNKIKLKRRKH